MDSGNIQEVAQRMVELQITSMKLRAVWGDITSIFSSLITSFSDGIRFLNIFNNLFAAAGSMVGTFESTYKKDGLFGALMNSLGAGFDGFQKPTWDLLDEIAKREAAFEKMQSNKQMPGKRSMAGINDEIEARKAQAALQKKINDAAFQQMTREQQLNSLFAQRLHLFEKIRNASGKKKFELMSQDFDLFRQMQGLQAKAGTSASSGRAMTQSASQSVGAFSKRVNPMVAVAREHLGIARQSLNVQQQILARQTQVGRSPY
jgi:hypothetical protein